MVASTKKRERVDLEKIAAQLASVKLLAIAGEHELILRASARFAARSFIAGEYRVSVGVRQVILYLDCSSFDVTNAYQAVLPEKIWNQNWKKFKDSYVAGSVEGKIGWSLANIFRAGAEGRAAKENRESGEEKVSAPYPIVSAMPTGWQIGTELGDPRVPDGTLPKGLDYCLNGEYLSGRNGEVSDGFEEDSGKFALCILEPQAGGNDPRIIATLFATPGSLRVAVSSSEPSDTPQTAIKTQTQEREREKELREAFVQICVQRAETAREEGAQTEAMLSGEIYLNHHEIHSPKLPKKSAE